MKLPEYISLVLMHLKKQIFPYARVQTVQERFRIDKDNASFEIAASFPSLYRRVKKRGNFKISTDCTLRHPKIT